MRLINTTTLQLGEFFDREVPDYAILSHRWGEEEVTFEEYLAGQKQVDPGFRAKDGYRKILSLCRIAREGVPNRSGEINQFQWAWIDTVCIDKRSSAELSEAINSMYQWYQMATVCLVFLPDVTALLQPDTEQNHRDVITVPGHSSFKRDEFLQSTWFTRGWTLQELIAPKSVLFYDKHLHTLGSIFKGYPYGMNASNAAFYHATAEAARMDFSLLTSTNPAARAGSIASILSWAAHRRVTRAEDMAYSLLGLCKVNMPLLYGEGGLRAFRRLQLEIISSTSDLSIFAFRQNHQDWDAGLLARHLHQFSTCQGPPTDLQTPRVLTRTPRGLEFEVRIPWGMRHRFPNFPLLLLTLTSNRGTGKRVHVLLRGDLATGYNDGYLACLRVGCYRSDHLTSERELWKQVMGWRKLDGTLFEFSDGSENSGALANFFPTNPISLWDWARKVMYSLFPAKTMKVWVPL